MGFLKWYKTRLFFQRIIDGLHISKTGTNIGLIELSGPYKPLIQFSYYHAQKLIRALFGMLPYPRGDRNLGKGMRRVKKLLFDARKPSRKTIKKVLIVFADTQSTDDVSAPAEELKKSGIEVFTIGYEKAAKCSKKELSKIASSPQDDHVILTDLFLLDLRKIARRLVKTMCKSKDRTQKKVPKKENTKKKEKTKKEKKKNQKSEKKKEQKKVQKNKKRKEQKKEKKKEQIKEKRKKLKESKKKEQKKEQRKEKKKKLKKEMKKGQKKVKTNQHKKEPSKKDKKIKPKKGKENISKFKPKASKLKNTSQVKTVKKVYKGKIKGFKSASLTNSSLYITTLKRNVLRLINAKTS